MSRFEHAARAAWGTDLEPWVLVLARACDSSSQNKVSRQLKRSSAMVSQTINRKYVGDLEAFKELVEGVFMASKVACPILGDLPTNVCQEWRKRASGNFTNINTQHVQMYRACTRCPVNKTEEN